MSEQFQKSQSFFPKNIISINMVNPVNLTKSEFSINRQLF